MTNRTFYTATAAIAALTLSLAAHAAPGWQVNTFEVKPIHAAAVVAALDKWMNSPVSKQFKGRMSLQAHIADGADPATHSLLIVYGSAAEQEAFGKLVQQDAAYQALLETVVPISNAVETIRGVSVKSWGEVSDKDVVWMHHSFTTSKPAAVLAAMDAWMSSPGGKRHPGEVHLGAILAGGLDSPSHVASIGFESIAEMEKFNDTLAADPDYARFLEAMRAVTEYRGAQLSQTIMSWGTAPLASITN